MHIATSNERIGLTGNFTFADHDAFREFVIRHIDTVTDADIVIDLGGLEYIDSAGLGMLLLARDAAQQHGHRVVLSGAHDQVARILAVSNFDKLFDVRP